MQLSACYYAFYTISVAASCVQSVSQPQELADRRHGRHLDRRDASIIIDNFPLDDMLSNNPNVIYRKISKLRYRAPRPKYRLTRQKYVPVKVKSTKSPAKKYKVKKVKPKFGPNNKKRSPKPRFARPNNNKYSKNKPRYENSHQSPHIAKNLPPKHFHNTAQQPAGFGEPPSDFRPHNMFNLNHAEPPVDSYGAPLKASIQDPYPMVADLTEFDSHDNVNSKRNTGINLGNWRDVPQSDSIFSFSHHYKTFVKPGTNGKPPPRDIMDSLHHFNGHEQDFSSWQNKHIDSKVTYLDQNLLKPEVSVFDYDLENSDHNLNSYSDVYRYTDLNSKPHYIQQTKKKPEFLGDIHKLINKPWRHPPVNNNDDQILVGGQYAEPPGKYVAKFQPSAPMYQDDDDSFSPGSYLIPDFSTTISPYVNYKNSNMAFSPQNLNDAFSIVDK
ncbi:uncharacterized protein LOC126379734 [Pectinophora gossypiella]|uniref:uncharacterized protein LOC126379734 n=1 Tax=Pectinophora gossypiella TaxID=13191 RepID=UPI00214EE0FD|nr:uncharacterized protein LOC126379734 [Pectinophora gossypiella]